MNVYSFTSCISRCMSKGSCVQIASSARKEVLTHVTRSLHQPSNHSLLFKVGKEHQLHRCSLNKINSLKLNSKMIITRSFTTVDSNIVFGNFLNYKQFFHNSCKRLSTAAKRSFEINTNILNDVLVYTHNNDKFYRLLSFFGLFQMAIWGYMSLFAVQYLRVTPTVTVADTTDLPWWKALLYKEGQHKKSLSILSMAVGGIVLFITMTYPRRIVRDLHMLKGGKEVQITTYSWLGQTKVFKRPLEHISCLQSRAGSGHHVPLKIKGKSFYYLVDKQGIFHNTELFDFAIALKRTFK